MLRKSPFMLAKAALILLSYIEVSAAYSATAIVQPTGNLVTYWQPTTVNLYLEKWDPNIVPGVTDPFDTHYLVSEIQPTQDLYFVRVYAGPSDNGAIGTYIVRPEFIRGLSPEQIKNVLALPTLPNKIAYVKVPAGAQYGLWTGIAAPINTPAYPYGNGGAQQTKIIGKHTNTTTPPADPPRFADYSYVPVIDYMNPEYIGAKALSYAQTVSQGNAGNIAAYLDKHIPAPYSDMENVYTVLDFVNWMNNTPALTNALNQISPATYDSISTVSFRDNLFFTNILLNHTSGASQNINMGYPSSQTQPERKGLCQNTWVNISGIQGEESVGNERVGFGYQTAAGALGIDCQIRSQLRVGVGAGYMSSNISWSMSQGSALLNLAEVGIYSQYTVGNYFINSAITSGFDWTSTQRNINITGVGYGLMFVNGNAVISGPSDYLYLNRTASSHPTGENVGAQIIGGTQYQLLQWNIMPTAKIAYYYNRQNAFTETGADSLDLSVGNYNAQTLRTELAVQIDRDFLLRKNLNVNTNLTLGWAHDLPLNNSAINASFQSLDGSFTVYGYHQQTNSLLASVGLTSKIDKRLWLDGRYYANLSHGFNEQMIGLIFRYSMDS